MSDWARRGGARVLASGFAASVLLAAPAAGPDSTAAAQRPDTTAAAQHPDSTAAPESPAEGLPIRRVVIVSRTIYEPVPPGRLAPAYRLANRLHVRTRRGTIADQLLFAPGGRWSEAVGQETERNLRALDFLASSRVLAERDGDSARVTVETRDLWTTSPEFNLESVGSKSYGSVTLIERNLMGLGKSVAFSYSEDPHGRGRSVSADDPGVRGSRLRVHYAASNGSGGAMDQAILGVPFYAESTPFSYGLSWSRTTSVVQLFQRAQVAADFDQREEETEAFWGLGTERRGLVRRLTGSWFVDDVRRSPSRLEPGTPPEFAGAEENLRLRRLAVEGRLWRPAYIERTHINRMGLVEDFDLGKSIALKLGVAPRFLGSTASEGYARVRLDAGADTRFGFGWTRASLSTRVRRDPLETLGQIEARWVHQQAARHAQVLAAYGASGSRAPRDFQIVVGGLSGLRAYPVQAIAGRGVWRLNAEDRWTFLQNFGEILTAGAVAFADAARGWGPGSEGAGWFLAAGAGLRLALPQWSVNQVVRIDLAWPIQPTRDGRREPVLSFGSSQAF